VKRPGKQHAQAADGRGLLRGVLAALLVLTVLVPLESIDVHEGKGLLLVVFWLLLALSWCLVQRRYPRPVHWNWVDLAVLLLIASQFASCLVMASSGNARASWNTSWQWLGLGTSYFVIRQLLDRGASGRALAVVMVSLAITLSLQGFYESFHIIPQRYHRFFHSDESVRQNMLEDAGILAPLGTPLRYHFESRLRSSEPAATFSLTNSLAGFLTPWLVMLVGISLLATRRSDAGPPRPTAWHRRLQRIAPELLFCLLVGFCLILTKSRSSWVAIISVVMIGLLLRGRRAGSGQAWRLAAGLLVTTLLLGTAAFMLKRLDSMVFSQTLESLSYRFEYWFASLRIIADNPLFGVGPGNFQDYYTLHMLPTAHEVVADPHNWLLEIWTTGGTLSLAALLLLFVMLVRQLRRQPDQPETGPQSPALRRSVYAGAVAGMLLALPYSLLVGSPLDATTVVLVGLLVLVAVIARFSDWVQDGLLPRWLVLAALAGWSIHLLAAGGITAPGVSQAGWLLLALSLATTASGSNLAPQRILVVMLCLLATVAGLIVWGYQPMTASRSEVIEAQALQIQNRHQQAMRMMEQACQTDPLWPQPALELAMLHHAYWGQGEEAAMHRSAFAAAAEMVRTRDSHSATTHALIGTCYLVASQRTGDVEDLSQARICFAEAQRLFPTNSRILAQLAWTCWLLGDDQSARTWAEQAWQLNQKYRQNKFIELQLDKRRLVEMPFPGWLPQSAVVGTTIFKDLNQLVSFLRNPTSR